MILSHINELETIKQTEERITLARRNRMKLASHYVNVSMIAFFDYVGAVERIGKVISVMDRGLLLQFAGYKESFFFETLLELEAKGRIFIKID